MEVSIEKPSASNIIRKSRSLDLKSIYVKQSRFSASKSWSKKGIVGLSQESKLLKRKRSSALENRLSIRRKRTRKDASLSAFEFGFRRLRSSSNVSTVKSNTSVSSAAKENSNGLTGSAFNSSNSDCHAPNLGNDTPLSLSEEKNLTGLHDNTANAKQPQDSLAQKKTEKSNVRKRLLADLRGKSSNEAPYNEVPNNNKRKKKSNELKVDSVCGNDTVHHFKIGNGNSSQVANRKVIYRKNLPLPNNAGKSNGNFQEDYKENLEQTAARMLCSLFDPEGTECKEDEVTSPSKPVNGLIESKGLHAEVTKVDSAGRVLRPRKCFGKSFVRKRRHFYEVCLRDLDPFCIVKKRIGVFWPLDESWYFGLIKEYDPIRSLHFVRYDDHDEEWIDLRKERFKLLAFPSEIASKLNVNNSRLKGKQKYREEEVLDDNSSGSSTESEPIISWLAQRTKSSPVNNVKKQNCQSSVWDLNQSNIKTNKLFSSCLVSQSTDSSGDRKFPVVYFRRRFRNRKDGLLNIPEEHSFRMPIGPVGFLSSAPEEFTAVTTLLEGRQATLMLSSPLQSINKVVYKADSFWLCHAIFILQHGKLMSGFPLVNLELIFVDSDLGLRYFSLKLSLRMAVSLVSMLVRVFHKHDEQFSFKELQMPFTSIRFKISGMDNRVGQVIFVLFSFSGMEGSNRRYLEEKLKHNSVEMKELAKADCTYTNIKNLRNERNWKIFTFADPILAEGLSKGYSKDLAQQFLPEKLVHTNANPAMYFLDEKYTRPPLCYSPVPDKPSLLLGLHLKSLIEECPNKNDKLSVDISSSVEDPLDQVSSITLEPTNYLSVPTTANSGTIFFNEIKSPRDAFSTSNDDHWKKSSTDTLGKEINVIDNSASNRGFSSPDKSECGDDSSMNNLKLRDQMLDRQDENSFNKSNLVSEMNGFTIPNAKSTAPRSIWHRSRRTSISRTFGDRSKLWARDFMWGFSVSNSKNPRTEVSYSFSKSPTNHHKLRPYKNVKTNNSKGFSDYSGSPKNHLDSSICEANVLVITKEKGWRECGAQVLLDSSDQNWKIIVKTSGAIKYIYKAEQFLQPGTTNRFTRAMMWRGGKDWSLEFAERSQWALFKQMHEECYNRNMRAAAVKNIPTPGVCLIADHDSEKVEFPFLRNSSKYIRHVETGVDMALNPSRVIYDMDSDDEEWVSNFGLCSGAKQNDTFELKEDLFEKVIDKLEKLAYTCCCDEFTCNQLEELMADFGPLDAIKEIHDYWRSKRQKKRMPLVRQLQPPLWKHYEQQLKDWESAKSKSHGSLDSCNDQSRSMKKPAMFAFCLRPRGLEVPNKALKQHSHKKLLFSGHYNALARDQDGLNRSGRKFEEHSMVDKAVQSYESSESFSSGDVSDRCSTPKLFQSNSKKAGMFPSYYRYQKPKRNGVYEQPNLKQSHCDAFLGHKSDVDELRLRDASSAAQHAVTMAKLKREKAQWLMHKADLAIHRATVALVTAEAIRSSSEQDPSERDSIGDDG